MALGALIVLGLAAWTGVGFLVSVCCGRVIALADEREVHP